MKITSTVYVNQCLKFGDSIIEFKNGVAEVDDILFKEIRSSGFPNIYEEGKNPGSRTKAVENFDKTIKEMNLEYMSEIDRLKNVNASKTQELKEIKQQLANLKASYDKDIKALQTKLVQGQSSQGVVEVSKIEPTEEEEVRKDLESVKLPELQKIAIEQGGETEAIKKLTKKELVDFIMGKTE